MEKQKGHFKQVFGRLYHFMKPYRKGLIASIFLTVLASFFGSLGPFILGKATDSMIGLIVGSAPSEEGIRRFVTLLTMLAAISLLSAVIKFVSGKILAKVSQKTIYDLRAKVDQKLKKLPLDHFDNNTYGDILSRMTNDVATISGSLQQSLDQFVTSITEVVCIFVMMIRIDPILTLIGVITVPAALFASMTIMRSSQKHFQKQQQMLGDLNGFVEEVYTGHDIVSGFGMQKESIRIFEEKNEELHQSAWKAQFMSSTMMPITQGMSNIGYVAVVVVSGWLVIRGRMTVGMIQSFIQYLRQFSQPIIQTVQIASILQSTAAAAGRVFEFLDAKEETADPSPSQIPDRNDMAVEFEHVRFGYSPDRVLMRDIDLRIEAGTKVAIVGPTGAGKTTLVDLLLRFYDVDGGAIRIGGADIRSMKRTDLREVFGMVLQDTWLFSGSIMENIRYGRSDATDEEVIAAAKAARADSFIRALPDGYGFVLQENAANLAQGERQLLTIARAILANAPIMILDEATSSVDTRTEVLIQEAMATLMKGRTSFVIAHRLSTVRDADIILYMDQGDIKEIGDHETLIKKNGLYAKLYDSQFAAENEA
ncbi:MAG: ABC transporter ATP-binding protein [Peptostreptococcaceae bacterium]|nr:ABC transporter ATP-binding protein [Peptostreptococcaceae bacterium]